MRIISYNVNSVRERLRAVRRVIRKYDPDVLCLQETKVTDDLFPREAITELGLEHLVVAGQKGYHGVAVASKHALRRTWSHALNGVTDKRHLAVELATGLEIHNLYAPAGGDKPNPDANPKFARKLAYLDALADWMQTWPNRARKARVLVGDLNVAPLDNDVWDHRKMRRTMTHTEAEVTRLERAQRTLPWTDAARAVVPPDEKLFTWWSYRAPNWRGVNKGRRLDHAWVSPSLRDRIAGVTIATEVRGWKRPSDHAPVVLDLALRT